MIGWRPPKPRELACYEPAHCHAQTINRISLSLPGTNRRPRGAFRSVSPVFLRTPSVRIKNATVRTIARCLAAQRQAAPPWPPTHGRCANDLFLIRTEETRRTTGNTGAPGDRQEERVRIPYDER
jgi:hypothetical protein